MPPNKRRAGLWILFTLASLLYLATARRFYVGYFSDDARDILAAKSLLQGVYGNLQLPNNPPLNFPLPGFPILLTPFVALLAPHWAWLKVLPIFLTLACLFGVYTLYRRCLSDRAMGALLLLCAFNPTTLAFSSQVIADSSYLLACLMTFWLITQEESVSHALQLAIVASLAAIIRPEGILLVLSLACGVVYARRWLSFASVAMAGVLWLAILFGNHLRTGSVSGYLTFLNETLPFLSQGPRLLFQNGYQLLKTLVLDVLLGLSIEPHTLWQRIVTDSAIIAGTAMMAGGLSRWLNSPKTPPALGMALGIYGLLHLGVHTVWLAVDPHYLWPLLPFAAFFLIFSIDQIKNPRIKAASVLCMALAVIALYGRQMVYAIEQTVRIPVENSLPRETFEWVTLHTSQDAYVLTPHAASLTLYTNRYSTAYVGGVDPDHFRFLLLESNITYVLTSPFSFLHVRTTPTHDPQHTWTRIETYVQEDAASYEPLYHNESEQTAIYRVHPSPEFQRAYRQYRAAMMTFASAPIKSGASHTLDELEAVLRIDPIPSVLNAFGATALLTNRRLARAQRHLEEAVRMRPHYALAWENLARVYARTGDVMRSRKAYKQAYEITLTTQPSPDNKHP